MTTTEDHAMLLVNGKRHTGWTQLRIERAMTQAASTFRLATAELGSTAPEKAWPVETFDQVKVFLGADLVLTGHVDVIAPSFDSSSRSVAVSGRSLTADLVDCNSEVDGGEFRGTTLDAIARAVCRPFGLEVVVRADMGDPFPIAAIERTETVWQFLERLCRLRGVLLTDDEQGRVVLTTVAEDRAFGSLVQGANLKRASATLDMSKRFSRYIVRSQTPIASARNTWRRPESESATAEEVQPPGGGVGFNVYGQASDPTVPRYRPRIANAEHALDQAGSVARARWEASFARGRAAVLRVSLAGWRDEAGALWRPNTLCSVNAPWMRAGDELLIVAVAYALDAKAGRTTDLTLGPVEGYTPDPSQVKRRKAGGGTARDTWRDPKPIT